VSRPLQVLDLFSGIGGMSLGLERAGGFRTAAFCEIDPFCRAELARNWPGARIYDDVRTLTAERLAADGIRPDVVAGGFPCQDTSLAGQGEGLDGERSGLWYEMLRIVAAVRPRWALVENVPGLRSRGLDTVLRGLASVGLDAEWHCIPASAAGAPHPRDRLWIVAYPPGLGGQGGGAAGLPLAPLPIGARLSGRDGAGIGAAHWSAEPGVGRLADGLPSRMAPHWRDPIHAFGNALVPQIPEAIGLAMLDAMSAAA
jgi:DNA (cytosine-5)-methyltransferase 1